MKKIPTLFEREFEEHKVVKITDKVTKGLEWVLEGYGVATVKYDGSCCAIINEEFYKRYDAKRGKKVPDGAIECCAADAITGHHPYWVKVDVKKPDDRWYIQAYLNTANVLRNGTYEAIGVHFRGNPYGLDKDILVPHGIQVVIVPRTFEGIKQYLMDNYIEGLVFWLDGEPRCKIKRSDFGLEWNSPKKRSI